MIKYDIYKDHFSSISDFILSELLEGEKAAINYSAEDSFFMRFNNAQVRQIGSVSQSFIDVKLFKDSKTYNFSLGLKGTIREDENQVADALTNARLTLALLPIDPYQVIPSAKDVSDVHFSGKLLQDDDLVKHVLEPAKGLDFTGLFTQGLICRASVTSEGAKHWFSTETFVCDFSAWLKNGKGVKSSYAGREWSDSEFAKIIASARVSLENLNKAETVLKPGSYRAYITSTALNEIVTFFSWYGFSERSMQQGNSAYLALRENRESFSEDLNVNQDFSLGVEPAFNEDGETAPELLKIIEKGKLVNTLVCSRTEKQYGVPSNASSEGEGLRSCSIASGTLKEEDALKALGTGIYVSNFHYLNWSDTSSARVTGMTRFACLWVEDGKIIGPIKDMRWDESLYNMLGVKLEALTQERHLIVETSTYNQRSVGGSLLPNILVNGLSFTL